MYFFEKKENVIIHDMLNLAKIIYKIHSMNHLFA